MKFSPESINRISSPGWGGLLDSDMTSTREWRPEELGAILKHQLTAPIYFDLGALDDRVRPKIERLCGAESLLVKSFKDLLTHPQPPLELLRLTKDFAKLNRRNPHSPLPPEVATVLYFSSIAVALARLGRRITTTTDSRLREGFEWVLAQSWLDQELRELIDSAMIRIST